MSKITYTSVCPMCSQTLSNVENCEFFACTNGFEGIKIKPGGDENVDKKGMRAPSDKLLNFKDSGEDNAEWRYMIIETQRL